MTRTFSIYERLLSIALAIAIVILTAMDRISGWDAVVLGGLSLIFILVNVFGASLFRWRSEIAPGHRSLSKL